MTTGPRLVLRVRTADPGDLPELRRIYRSASLANSGDADGLLARPELLELAEDAVAEGRTRLAETEPGARPVVLGFATVTVGDDGEPELDDLFVDPAWHRRGVARLLVEDAARSLATSGHRRLWVTANPHASAFYTAAGFTGSERVETELGPGLRLQLALTRP